MLLRILLLSYNTSSFAKQNSLICVCVCVCFRNMYSTITDLYTRLVFFMFEDFRQVRDSRVLLFGNLQTWFPLKASFCTSIKDHNTTKRSSHSSRLQMASVGLNKGPTFLTTEITLAHGFIVHKHSGELKFFQSSAVGMVIHSALVGFHTDGTVVALTHAASCWDKQQTWFDLTSSGRQWTFYIRLAVIGVYVTISFSTLILLQVSSSTKLVFVHVLIFRTGISCLYVKL